MRVPADSALNLALPFPALPCLQRRRGDERDNQGGSGISEKPEVETRMKRRGNLKEYVGGKEDDVEKVLCVVDKGIPVP